MKILDNSSFSDILVFKYITVKFAPTFVAAHHTDIFNRPFPSSPLPLSKQNESTCETIHMEVFLSTGLFSCKSNFAKTCFVHTGTRQLGNGLPRYILSIVTSLIPLSFLIALCFSVLHLGSFGTTLSRPLRSAPRLSPYGHSIVLVPVLFLSLPVEVSWLTPDSWTVRKQVPSFYGWCPLFWLGIRLPGDKGNTVMNKAQYRVRKMRNANLH